MSRRLAFLAGHLSGLLVGALLALALLGYHREARGPTVIPPAGARQFQPVVVRPVPGVPGGHAPWEVPKHWQPRDFNGQPYYIIPLQAG